ncbi:MAG TPA: hemerythrin domain-containing protein [Streptosporangiaceae bacterium]|nr:hemerythrin domain-containing protein [Streptosporangiaceae bacterium]
MKGHGLPRRSLLAAGGGLVAGGAAGAGLTAAFSVKGQASGQPAWVADEAQPSPGEDLMSEHGLLIRILLIYRKLSADHAAGRPVPAEQAQDAAVIIHDFVENFHEELEEAYVFPRVRKAGQFEATISTLLLQHARGRQQTQLILAETGGKGALAPGPAARVVGAMDYFVRMYEPHEAREDTVIYPAFRSLMTPPEVAELGAHFAELERQQFGKSGFPVMVGRVAAIEQALGIYDLTQFTPPNTTPPNITPPAAG